jgi:benzodiazapine receptor
MIQSYERPTWKRDAAFAALAIGAVAAASILGQIATYPNLSPWFARLVKSPLNPPNWVFGPV